MAHENFVGQMELFPSGIEQLLEKNINGRQLNVRCNEEHLRNLAAWRDPGGTEGSLWGWEQKAVGTPFQEEARQTAKVLTLQGLIG